LGVWDELVDEHTHARAFCESRDWEAEGTGKQRVSEIAHAASEHMESLHHSVKVEIALGFDDTEEDAERRRRLEAELATEEACLQVLGIFSDSATPRARRAARRVREINALLHPEWP
jgi:hypothetical protein